MMKTFNEWFLENKAFLVDEDVPKMKMAWQILEADGVDSVEIEQVFNLICNAFLERLEI